MIAMLCYIRRHWGTLLRQAFIIKLCMANEWIEIIFGEQRTSVGAEMRWAQEWWPQYDVTTRTGLQTPPGP